MLPMLCPWWWLAPWYSPGCLTHIPNCLAGSPHGHITDISNSSLSPPQFFYVSKQHHCLSCPDTRDILESSLKEQHSQSIRKSWGLVLHVTPSDPPSPLRCRQPTPCSPPARMAVINPRPVPLPPLQSVLGQQPAIVSLPCLKAFADFSLS